MKDFIKKHFGTLPQEHLFSHFSLSLALEKPCRDLSSAAPLWKVRK